MIETIPETGSTSADLAARLTAGERIAEGDWLVADRQSSGRGRLGRVWSDGAGNFMGSTVVRLRDGDPPASTLALVAGLAVHETISALLPPPARAVLKWPNDLLVGSAKLAGILLERVGDAVVVGIGVNLAAAPDLPDRSAAALSQFGPAPDRDAFAAGLAHAFAADLGRWRTFGLGPILSRWESAGHPRGTPLTVAEVKGAFAGLADDGALRLALSDGTTRVIHAGEVQL